MAQNHVLPVDQQLKKIEEHKKKDSLIYSVLDGSAFAVMAGFGENYLNPFAIELGATNQQIGFFSSIPQLFGSCSQFFSATLVDYFKKRKALITTAVLFQAATWIPLILLPFFPKAWWISLAFLFYILYFVCGHSASPPWNSLMGDLVPAEKRGFFFGKRNKITGCITFLSVFAAGLVLNYFQATSVLFGFSIIFVIAFIARLVSWGFLTKMVELPYQPIQEHRHDFLFFLRSLHKTNTGLFILFLCLMNFSVQIAGPFFSAYMLRDLSFSYLEFMLVNIMVTITTFLTMTYWGTSADYYGNKKIITITAILLPIIPLLWLFSHSLPYLMTINIISGFAWAGFNLASTNFLFDNTASAERARYFAYYNMLNGFSVFLGATLGGFLATHITMPWIFISQFQILFLISGILRACISFTFLPRINEVRIVHPVQTKELFWNLVAVRPLYGMGYELILGLNKLEAMAERVSHVVEETIDDVENKLRKKKRR